MKYFVFDLGGVLSVPMVSKKLYEQIKWKVSYDEFLDKFNNSEESIKVHKGEISTKEFFEYLKGYMNDNITLEEFKNIYVNNNEFFKDTIETIKKLKNLGYKVYLLSNLKEIDYEKFIKHFDVSIFDEMFLSFKLDMIKPNDDIYKYVINKFYRAFSCSNGGQKCNLINVVDVDVFLLILAMFVQIVSQKIILK